MSGCLSTSGRDPPPDGMTGDDDPAEVANMSDAGLSEPGLPAHEDDARRADDAGTREQNP